MPPAVLAGLHKIVGRDPHEPGRVASTLELLYDLTFVVAVGVAASHLAQTVGAGHVGWGVAGFVFAMLAIFITWINFSWFNSAFDGDDWPHRLLILVQMAGVVILAIGLDAMFASLHGGGGVDIRLMVTGYVVMRVSLVAMWARVALQVPDHRCTALRNIAAILVAQVAWVAMVFAAPARVPFFAIIAVLGAFEFSIPLFAQGSAGGTPWHRHHIAERYALFAIITLGEAVVGTVEAAREVLAHHAGAWSADVAWVVAIGLGVTFGVWWTYFLVPFGDHLHRRPGRGYVFGYGHIPVLMAIAATGAGIHLVGAYLEQASVLGPVATVLALVIPLALFLVSLQAVVAGIGAPFAAIRGGWLALAFGLLGLAVLLAASGVSITACLAPVIVAMFVPAMGHQANRRPSVSEADTMKSTP